ncbi:hypothetical protein AURDEDRAFT_125464 [Auricularia subglabra TFB-10046 SS5]|nr:hypothetical protein AURDEDRAFT_125464 [Auricularia subglabra TFB-10046 SS5]
MTSLIGGIVERPRSNAPPSAPSPSSSTSAKGFPVAKHRSQSAFARARQTQQKPGMDGRPPAAPEVLATSSRASPLVNASGTGDEQEHWRAQISEQNAATVANMTAEERQKAISEIFDTLGDGVGDLLQRARAARERKRAAGPDLVQAQNPQLSVLTKEDVASKGVHTPGTVLIPSAVFNGRTHHLAVETPLSSRPATPTRSALRSAAPRPTPRKVSFQEVQPHDVHVYESQPPSPRKVLGLLAPPSEDDAGVPVQKLSYVPMAPQPALADEPMEIDSPSTPPESVEDDPAAIRARFFPNEPMVNPSLEWLKQPEGAADDTRARFDLKGQIIPPELVDTLPSHLGLHHHAQGSRAGYTLEDVLLLSHSTVPAQRATMLGVLASIVRQLAAGTLDTVDLGVEGGRDVPWGRILEAAIDALGEPGSLGVRAADVVWEGVMCWDQSLLSLSDVWLDVPHDDPTASPSTLSSLPLPQLLGHMKNQFAHAALPPESLEQLLTVLYRLVRHSISICKTIMSSDGLLQAVSRLFLPTRHGQGNSSDLAVQPNPLAIKIFRALAASSREHALALTEVADSLLRYVVTFDACGPPLDLALAAETLHFYACLARYGLYASVASLASEHFAKLLHALRAPNLSAPQVEALRAFLRVTEAWTVCATDPHKTTPEHDLVWSQVAGWDWGGELLALASADGPPALHADLWGATAAWLDGCKLNSMRAGADEKERAIAAFLDGFRTGHQGAIVRAAVQGLSHALHSGNDEAAGAMQRQLESIHEHAAVLHQAARLAVATAKPGAPGALALCLGAETSLSALLTTIPGPLLQLQQRLAGTPRLYTLLRPLTSFIYSLHALISITSTFNAPNLVATSASIFRLLLPGDEDLAASLIRTTLRLAGPDLFTALDMPVPAAWKDDALLDLEPFLLYALRPKSTPYLPPWTPSPDSNKNADSQTLPAKLDSTRLPAANDWPFWPLNELLQSGTSPLFRHLPPGWDATETDVVRASLLLVHIIQRSIARSSLSQTLCLRLSQEEAIFGCMRVFMLEHGQDSSGSSQEVFRDDIVEARMRDLLRPFTVANRAHDTTPSDNIERVAARYLGKGMPFFQFYTDFVALYDAVSFAHPVFATLLLPPLAMRYAHDYRKLLFSEFRMTLKNISVQVPNLLADDPIEFMRPIERNPEVVGAMLGALLKGEVRDFLRAMCVQHVACNIWPDLEPEGTDDARLKLLRVVVAQGSIALLREIVLYGGLIPHFDNRSASTPGTATPIQDVVKELFGTQKPFSELLTALDPHVDAILWKVIDHIGVDDFRQIKAAKRPARELVLYLRAHVENVDLSQAFRGAVSEHDTLRQLALTAQQPSETDSRLPVRRQSTLPQAPTSEVLLQSRELLKAPVERNKTRTLPFPEMKHPSQWEREVMAVLKDGARPLVVTFFDSQ